MTLQIAFLFALLVVMITLFLTERIPVDLTAFLGLVVLILGGYVAPDEAFSGFASRAVITMLSIFIVGGALLETGVANVLGGWVHRVVGDREPALIVSLMLVAGGLSAFMNNIAAVAVLMPAVASVSRRAGIAPSRLFLPLSFGAILGGTTTLVGTPPNIVAGAILEERGLGSFSLFEFTPFGLLLLAAGVLFMVTIGRRLLPHHGREDTGREAHELTRSYGLEERLFSVVVPEGSHLQGHSLAEVQLGSTLGFEVIAVMRGGGSILAPDRATTLDGGDRLLVKGKRSDLAALAEVRGIEVVPTNALALPGLARGVGGVRASLEQGSDLAGGTVRALRIRERFGLVVVGIVRDGELQMERLASEALAVGDELIALGTRADIERLASHPGVRIDETGLAALGPLEDRLFTIQVAAGSPMEGQTVGATRLGSRVGLTVGGLIRDGVTRLGIAPDEILRAGDGLVVAGEPWRLLGFLELGDAPAEADVATAFGASETTGVVEVAVAPRSSLAGKTLRQLGFRSRYGLQVLSVWSRGEARRTDLTDLSLGFGDALLLQGPWERIVPLARDPDFVVLSGEMPTPRRTEKAPVAVAGLLLMVTLVVGGVQPIHVAAFTAASLILLFGALQMEQAYRVIEWRVIFLVAAVMPVGMAMERTGAAALLSDGVTAWAGPFGPHAVLAALVLLSSLLSQGLDGAPAVVLLAPVVLGIAETLSIDPRPLMMGVSLAASAAFMTPFSHKANLLVMSAGGYRSKDYLRVGTPLTVAVLVIIIVTVPLLLPF